MANLSQRVLNAGHHIIEKMFECNNIKQIMSDDITGNIKINYQRTLRVLQELQSKYNNRTPKAFSTPGLNAIEKAFFEKIVNDFPSPYDKYIQSYETLVGPIPGSIRSEPLSSSCKEFLTIFEKTFDTGSVIEVVVLLLARYNLTLVFYNHIVSEHSQEDLTIPLNSLEAMIPIMLAFYALKGFIDDRSHEVSSDEEKRLIALVKRVNQIDLNILQEWDA